MACKKGFKDALKNASKGKGKAKGKDDKSAKKPFPFKKKGE